MQRVKKIENIGIENMIITAHVVYDNTLDKFVIDVCGVVPGTYSLVMLAGGDRI
jgi:hypothetical protein